MRAVTFSDDRVRSLLARDFVCVWRNIRPEDRFPEVYAEAEEKRRFACIKSEDGSANICAFVVKPDGKILHAIQGFQNAAVFAEELEFALRLRSIQERESLKNEYRKRYGELKRKADSQMYRNLRWLEADPLQPLEPLLGLNRAGFPRVFGYGDPSKR